MSGACSDACEGADLTTGRPGPRFPIRVSAARDPARIVAWLLLRLAVAEIALVVGLRTPGTIGAAIVAAGGLVLAYVVLLAVHVLSLRLDIRPGEISVASVLVHRRYVMTDGPLTRLRVEQRRGVFGTQLGAFGIEIGSGESGGREIDVVRLAPIAKTILIPTMPRGLAVVPASEAALTRALQLAGRTTLAVEAVKTQVPASRDSR